MLRGAFFSWTSTKKVVNVFQICKKPKILMASNAEPEPIAMEESPEAVLEVNDGASTSTGTTVIEAGNNVEKVDILEISPSAGDMDFGIDTERDLLTQRRLVASVHETVRSPCDLDGLANSCEHTPKSVSKLVGDPNTCPICEVGVVVDRKRKQEAALKRKIADLTHDNSVFNQEMFANKTEIDALRQTIVGLRKAVDLHKGPQELEGFKKQIIKLEEENYALKKKFDKAKDDLRLANKARTKAESFSDRCRLVNKQLSDENCEFRKFMSHVNGQYQEGAPLFHMLMNMLKQFEFNSGLLQALWKKVNPNDVIHYRMNDQDVIGRWQVGRDGAIPLEIQCRTKMNPHDLKPYSLLYANKPEDSSVTDAFAREPEEFALRMHEGLDAFNLKMLEAARAVNREANKTTPHGTRSRRRDRAFAAVSVNGRETTSWDEHDYNRDLMAPCLRPPQVKGRNPLHRREGREAVANGEHVRTVVDESGSRARSRARNRTSRSRSKSGKGRSRSRAKPSATVTSEVVRVMRE